MSNIKFLKDYLKKMKKDPLFAEKEHAKFKEWMLQKERPAFRASLIINSMTDNEFKKFLIKVFQKEAAYDKRGSFSYLFDGICNIVTSGAPFHEIEPIGTPLEFPEDVDFLAARHFYKGFIFELYIGQGSFFRIYHQTEKIGYQS